MHTCSVSQIICHLARSHTVLKEMSWPYKEFECMNNLSIGVSGILKEGEWFLRWRRGERQKIELIPSHNKKKRWGKIYQKGKMCSHSNNFWLMWLQLGIRQVCPCFICFILINLTHPWMLNKSTYFFQHFLYNNVL